MVVRQSVEISFRGSLPKQVATAVNPRPTGRLAAVGALVTDDRQGDRAVGDLRAGRLWGAQRHSRRVGARDAGGIAAAVRPFDGLYGHRRAGDLGRPQPERAFRAADAEAKTDGCSCSRLAWLSAARCSGEGKRSPRRPLSKQVHRCRSSLPRRRAARSRRIGRV